LTVAPVDVLPERLSRRLELGVDFGQFSGEEPAVVRSFETHLVIRLHNE
jgi:hypothetical protein